MIQPTSNMPLKPGASLVAMTRPTIKSSLLVDEFGCGEGADHFNTKDRKEDSR